MTDFFGRISLLFSLAPVLRGFLAMVISGACFPLCGVMVLRLNLIPLRYMLMHGVILGGALSLAVNLPLVPLTIFVNLLMVLGIVFLGRNQAFGFGYASAAGMILSMAFASIIMHVKNVPAKDSLSLLWGSPFALKLYDVILLLGISLLLLLYLVINFHNILALFFNNEISRSIGINVKLHYTFMVMLIALVVSVAMKLLGAFLIDSLLILPVLCASRINLRHFCGIKKLFLVSSVLGLLFSLVGYVIAVICNLPPAATISVVAGGIFIIFSGVLK
ncbi:MAG: metal ABC transporter permease [Treponema sp.]|jgi:zinc transport system permease protein|nr:metal ABC transporter permease [Treponema sp.]